MEDNNNNDRASSYSWWWDSHNCSNHSQWLQNTLLDLDNKIKAMLNLIQEDGDTFAKRAEMYYKKKPELIKMVEDFHRSYRSLAEKYDQLRSESIHATNQRSMPNLNSLKQVPEIQICTKGNTGDIKLEAPVTQPELVFQDPKHAYDESRDIDFDILAHELVLNGSRKNEDQGNPRCNQDFGGRRTKIEKINVTLPNDNIGNDQFQISDIEREKMWNEMRLEVCKLIDDTLRQQDELIRRNDDKREAIKDLYCQINKLMDENRALKNSLTCYNHDDVKQNQSQMSRLKGLFLARLSQ